MESPTKNIITVKVTIKAPVEKVWHLWNDPKHIVNWYFASDDWHTPRAENDLKIGSKFLFRMEAKDGSAGFDFYGTYTQIIPNKLIENILGDGRKLNVTFDTSGNETTVTEIFEIEDIHTSEQQRQGWQAILNNFKKYVDSQNKFQRIHFNIAINTTAGKVYSTMIDPKKYSIWTAEFNPHSHFEGSWNKGSKILFIGEDGKGNRMGMVSRIAENIPNSYISIEHIGLLKDHTEITDGPEAEPWKGSFENYIFKESNGVTTLSIEMDSNSDYIQYFKETWPKALMKIKEISEK